MICDAALFDMSVNNPFLALGYNHIHSFKFSNDFPFCKFIFFSFSVITILYRTKMSILQLLQTFWVLTGVNLRNGCAIVRL